MSCCKPMKIKNPYYWFHNSAPRIINVPCNWCLNCRVDRRNFLEDCANYEYRRFGCGSFVTLTYDDYHIVELPRSTNPDFPFSADYSHVKKFLQSCRNYIRYHHLESSGVCSSHFKVLSAVEYGEHQTHRPHYHLIVLGVSPTMMKFLIRQLWHFARVNDCGFIRDGGIRYVLKYIDKECHGKQAFDKYTMQGLEIPRVRHSPGLATNMILDNYDAIRANHWCYKSTHNRDVPIPTYYKVLFRASTDYDRSLRLKVKSFNQAGFKPDCFDGTYSLRRMNQLTHQLSLLRAQHIASQLRNDGIPADNEYFTSLVSKYAAEFQVSLTPERLAYFVSLASPQLRSPSDATFSHLCDFFDSVCV